MLPSLGKKGPKPDLEAGCWEAPEVNFACAVSIICAALPYGTGHIAALTLKCCLWSWVCASCKPRFLSDSGPLEDNKHSLNSHRHWHNWKIRPLGSYILTGCFNCSPYILSIFTECSIYTEVAEKRGQVCYSVTEFRQEKNIKLESSLPFIYFCITVLELLKAGILTPERTIIKFCMWYFA